MRLSKILLVAVFSVTVAMVHPVLAQTSLDPLLLDGIRYNSPLLTTGAVGVSMGTATVTSDYDPGAWFINPASLGLQKSGIVDLGFRFRSGGVQSDYLGETRTENGTSSDIDHFNFIYPYPVDQGSFVISLGYSQFNLFDQTAAGGGFNSQSSLAESFSGYIPSQRFATSETNSILSAKRQADIFFDAGAEAFLIFSGLSPSDPGGSRLRSLAFGNVDQAYTAITDGSLYSWSAGFSTEVAEGIFIGASLQIIGGFYLSTFDYKETARGDFYRQRPDSGIVLGPSGGGTAKTYVFNALQFITNQDDDISGYGFRIGTLAKITDEIRIGATYVIPTQLTVDSKYTFDLYSWLEETGTGSSILQFGYTEPFEDIVKYDLSGPTILEGNVGYQSFPLSGEVGFTWTDYSGMKFSGDGNWSDLNNQIRLEFEQTIDLKAGVQYAVPQLQSMIRAGYLSAEDPVSGDRRNYYSLGYEYLTEGGFRLVLGYQVASFTQEYTNYVPINKPAVKYTEEETLSTFSISTIFKF